MATVIRGRRSPDLGRAVDNPTTDQAERILTRAQQVALARIDSGQYPEGAGQHGTVQALRKMGLVEWRPVPGSTDRSTLHLTAKGERYARAL